MKVEHGFTSTVPGLDPRRIALGISKAEIARRIGVTRGLIGQYISGKADPPAEKVTKLAEALDCSTDVILYLPQEAQVSTNSTTPTRKDSSNA